MKKNYQCVLAALFVLLFSNLSFAENEDPCTKPTTLTKIDEVYQIGSCGDLYKFAEMVNNGEFDDNINGKLIADICVNACGKGESVLNADGTLNGSNFKPWTPIKVTSGKKVTLNGAGKTISGLYFNDGNTDKVGLFGEVTGALSISDLGVKDSYFKGRYYVGGLVGDNGGELTITNSYNEGTVSGDNDVGGLVGENSATLTITNSYNAGTVSGNSEVGGLVGYNVGENAKLTITNSYNAGPVGDSGGFIGGLVGDNGGGTLTITNSFFLATGGSGDELGGKAKSVDEFCNGSVALSLHDWCEMDGDECKDGGLNGLIWGQNVLNGDLLPNFSREINAETEELVLRTFEGDNRKYPTKYIAGLELPTDLTRKGYVFLGWSAKETAGSSADIVTSIALDATGKKEFYAQWMKVSEKGCYEIGTAFDLYAFANVVNNATNGSQICGMLVDNIVVNTCDDGKSVLKDDGSLNCSGEMFKPWTPMNVQSGVQVTFNGKGKTISGLYFDNGNKENVGLFGGGYGTVAISNLNIVDSYFKGRDNVGGLVGYNSGSLSIENSYNAGSVSGNYYVGGLVGRNGGSLSIENSYNAGTVSGGKDNVGGLVGGNSGELTIRNSYNAGTVSGRGVYVGGLVGNNDGEGAKLTIENSYNAGTVSGSGDDVGGLVGANKYYSTLTITNSYNAGAVSGGEESLYVGGLVGYNGANAKLTITNSYNAGTVSGVGVVGGLVGYNGANAKLTITNSYNAGTVSGNSEVGGLVGENSGATLTITNSYNAGTVSRSGRSIGGLVGGGQGTLTIAHSFFLATDKSGDWLGGEAKSADEFANGTVAHLLRNYVQTDCEENCIDGTIWGQDVLNGDLLPNFSDKITGTLYDLVLHTFEGDVRKYPTEYVSEIGLELPTDLVRDGYIFSGWSAKETAESSADIVTSIAKNETGAKTFYAQWKELNADGCFEIASTVELYGFANVVNNATDGSKVCGTLTTDIVVNTGVLNTNGALNGAGSNFKQWTPIKVTSGKKVTFNGAGKTISGLYFNNEKNDYVGLFGEVTGALSISNLGIRDSYFKGCSWVGGLVGGNGDSLTITNSYNAGLVSGSGVYVGGLVGGNGDTLTITNSYNAGLVSGSDGSICIGGLVGVNGEEAMLTITNSYNAGTVSGSGDDVGGLVGGNGGTLIIAHSFFLTAGGNGDGLGGELKSFLDEFHDGTVAMLLHHYVQTDCGEENCIDGTVWGQDLTNANSLPDFSGKVGTPYSLTLHTFDEDAREYPTEYVSEIGLELPTDLVRDGYVFAGWSTKQVSTSMADIVTSIAKGSTGDKEFYAQWMKVSEEGVYEIATAADLYKFAQLVNGGATNINGKLTANICVNACGEGESVLKADGTLNGDGSEFTPWTPIGAETQKFNGTFDGAGHTISGLYVDGAEYAGLFGYVFVDNINVEDEKGVVKNVGIEDSYISGTKYVGGVVAYNAGRTLSVYNAGNVTGSGSGCATGGVVGYNDGLVSDAYNAGAVKSSVNDCSTGGVVGHNEQFVYYSYNIGTVSGGANVGGVAGSNGISKSSSIFKAYYNTEIFTGDAVGSGNLPNPAAGKTAVELSSLEIVDLVSDKDHVGSSAWVVGSGGIVMSANKLVYKLPGLKVFSTQPEIVLMQANDQNVFEIGSAQELKGFAEYAGSGEISINAKLTANICLNACGEGKSVLKADGTLNGDAANFEQWTPINTRYGTNVSLDGNGHTISGLYFSNSEQDNVGFFGSLQGTVSISNLGIVDSYFEGKDSVGVFVGVNDYSNLTITNCFGAGSVKGNGYVAGFVGQSKGTLNITNSYSVSIVNGEDYTGSFIGSGAFANVANSFFLNGSSNFGGTQKTADEFHNGTVAMLLHNWCEKDDGSETCKVGGKNGSVWGQDLTNANSLPDFSGEFAGGTLYALTLYTFDGNVRKYPTEYVSEIGFELPTDLVREGYVFAGWSTKQVSTSMADIVTSIAKGATDAKTFYAQWMKLNEKGVYEIATAVDLYKFAQLVNGGATNIKGKLTADICVNACGEGKSVLKADGTLNGDGSEFTQWTPIGTTGEKKMFNGTFDGAGHTISGLYFNDGKASYAGLFGKSTSGGSIKNVGVVDSYIKGNEHVGGIVGHNGNCKVSNVFSTSTVEGNTSTAEGGYYVGGIAGYNEAGTIVNAYNMGAVSGGSRVGGIAGYNQGSTAHINNVYSSGTVSGTSYVRGLVGYNNESKRNIDNAYYNKDVFGGEAVGNVDGTNVEGKTSAEFADGTVARLLHDWCEKNIISGECKEDGLDGSVWGQDFTKENSLPDLSGEFVGGIPRTLTLHTFEGDTRKLPTIYLEGSVLELPTGLTRENYVFLGWSAKETAESFADIVTSIAKDATGPKTFYAQWMNVNEKGCYEIGTAFELYGFANVVNNATDGEVCGTLAKDIVVNTDVLDENGALNGEGSNFTPWTPMNVQSGVKVTLDGNGHTISGLYFNVGNTDKVGLFGEVTGALSISDLGVKDSYFKGGSDVGGLVGYVYDGTLTIENSYNSGTVSGDRYVGGLVGYNNGGLVGYNNGGTLTIENSYNAGSVSGESFVGGLVGENINFASLTITNSYNAGAVSGDGVGGLVGVNLNNAILTITNSYNAGTVSGSGDYVGGLVGANSGGDAKLTITNSYSAGTVRGSGDYVGGVVGYNDGGTVSNGFFNTEVTCKNCEVVEGTTGMSSEEFADGTVALLLHNWCEKSSSGECKEDGLDGAVWGQNVGQATGNDAAPTLSGVLKLGPLTVAKNAAGKDSTAIDGASEMEMKIPAEFNVPSVTFKRTFAGNGGYSTIMLPFTPDFTAAADTIKGVNFYEFTSFTDGAVGVNPVSQWNGSESRAGLAANTPYLVSAAGATELVFKNGGTFNTTTGDAYDSETGEYKKVLKDDEGHVIGWTIYGTYDYKTWEEGDAGLGRTYGFAANDGVNNLAIVGKFTKVGAGAHIYPMRAYLEYVAPVKQSRPAANGAARAGAANTVASLPETINVVIVDKDETSGEQTTRVIGTINTRTGEFKFADDRWFDLNGRYLGNKKPTQKGAYYNNGKKVIVK